jgi:hypothetical protein
MSFVKRVNDRRRKDRLGLLLLPGGAVAIVPEEQATRRVRANNKAVRKRTRTTPKIHE